MMVMQVMAGSEGHKQDAEKEEEHFGDHRHDADNQEKAGYGGDRRNQEKENCQQLVG